MVLSLWYVYFFLIFGYLSNIVKLEYYFDAFNTLKGPIKKGSNFFLNIYLTKTKSPGLYFCNILEADFDLSNQYEWAYWILVMASLTHSWCLTKRLRLYSRLLSFSSLSKSGRVTLKGQRSLLQYSNSKLLKPVTLELKEGIHPI